MPRLKTFMLVALATALIVGGATTANATPQQAAKIKQLNAHIAKQNRAIASRNTTINRARNERATFLAQLTALRSSITTCDDANIFDTCDSRIATLTNERNQLQGALSASVVDQLNVMTPAQVFGLMPTIYSRMLPPYTRSVFSSSGFVSYSFSN